METDIGFYSNTILVLTTGLYTINQDEIHIWSSNNEVFIHLQGNLQTNVTAQIYTIKGKILGSYLLNEKKNSISLFVDRKLLIVQVQTEDRIITKKVLVW